MESRGRIEVQCRLGLGSGSGIGVQCCSSGREIRISIDDGLHWDVILDVRVNSVLLSVKVWCSRSWSCLGLVSSGSALGMAMRWGVTAGSVSGYGVVV